MNLTINPSHTNNPLEDLQILQMCLEAVDDLLSPDPCARLGTAESQDRLCLLLSMLHGIQAKALEAAWAERGADR